MPTNAAASSNLLPERSGNEFHKVFLKSFYRLVQSYAFSTCNSNGTFFAKESTLSVALCSRQDKYRGKHLASANTGHIVHVYIYRYILVILENRAVVDEWLAVGHWNEMNTNEPCIFAREHWNCRTDRQKMI